MLGILGNESTRDEILKYASDFTGGAEAYTAARVLGSPDVARRLREIVAAADASPDRDRQARASTFKQVLYRLEGRLR